MTQFATTYTRFDQVGVREQLSNIISNISPTDTPFMTNADKGKATNTLFEWQTDALAAASSSNQQIEGDDIVTTNIPAAVPTVRLKNYCEIARKLLAVSGTAQAVETAGRDNELSYQIAKQGKEIKRDMETSLLANKGAAAGSTSSARKTGSVIAFIKTNISKTGTAPVYTDTPTDVWTDGSTRAFTEVLLKDVVQQCFNSGAHPETVMVGAFNKQVASTFSGVVELNSPQKTSGQATIIGAANVYVSDFGNLTIIPNRFQRALNALVLDWDMVQINYLRPFQVVNLAKTGDAEKRMLIAEYGLQVNNEKGIGLVTDLLTS